MQGEVRVTKIGAGSCGLVCATVHEASTFGGPGGRRARAVCSHPRTLDPDQRTEAAGMFLRRSMPCMGTAAKKGNIPWIRHPPPIRQCRLTNVGAVMTRTAPPIKVMRRINMRLIHSTIAAVVRARHLLTPNMPAAAARAPTPPSLGPSRLTVRSASPRQNERPTAEAGPASGGPRFKPDADVRCRYPSQCRTRRCPATSDQRINGTVPAPARDDNRDPS